MTIATTELKIWLALRDHANTYAGIPPVDDGEYGDDDAFKPPTDANGLLGVYWIYDDMRFDVPRKYIDTSASDEQKGEFQVHIMIPLRFNYEYLRQMSGQVISHFPKDTRLVYDGLTVEITDTPKTIGASYRDGAYNRLPVIVRWRAG